MDIPVQLLGLTMPELLVALSEYFGDDIPEDFGETSTKTQRIRLAEAKKLMGDNGSRIYVPPAHLQEAFDNALQNPVINGKGNPNWSGTARFFGLRAQDLTRYVRFRLNTEPGIRP